MEKPKITRHYTRIHPTHLKALRERIELNGVGAVERELGLAPNGLKSALAGRGVYPRTLAAVSALVGSPSPAPLPPPALLPPPVRDLGKIATSFRELGAATALVLEVLSGVEATNRDRVLDMVRAAL